MCWAYACDPCTQKPETGAIKCIFQASLIYTAPASNKQKNKQVGDVAQLLDFLPRVYKILDLIFTST